METFRQVASVVLVFAMLGAALWALRRGRDRGFTLRCAGKAKSIESVERLTLTPQHALHLVRIGGRDLLVATHPQGCTLITESWGKGPAA